jgi:phosphatidylglycerophosphatase GEP4
VTYNTGAPVLRHKAFKPAYSCINAVRDYFSSLRFPIRDEELIIVGDRIFTDVVMANRMRGNKHSQGLLKMAVTCGYEDGGAVGKEKDAAKDRPRGPLAVWTTDVWEREAMAMRWCEKKLVDAVRRWTCGKDQDLDTSQFVRRFVEPQPTRTAGMMAGLFGRLRS